MKKLSTTLILFLSTCIAGLAQGKFYKGNNILMPQNLIVDYRVALKPCLLMVDGKCEDNFLKPFVENQSAQNLFEIIFDGAFKRKVNIFEIYCTDGYSFNFKKTDTSDVKEKMGAYTRKTMVEDEFGKSVEKSYEVEMDTSELYSLSFIEDWNLTEKPFQMTKKVEALCPVRKFYREHDENSNAWFRSLFYCLDTLENKKEIAQSDKRMILTNRIKYEYFLIPGVYNDVIKGLNLYDSVVEKGFIKSWLPDEMSPNFNDAGKIRFLNLIINKALKESYPVYDINSDEKMSIDEVRHNLKAEIDTIMVENVEKPGEFLKKVVEHQADLFEIKSIIFHEEWYIDPLTLRMKKKVVAVSPVRYIFNEKDSERKSPFRKILFTMYFDGMKKL